MPGLQESDVKVGNASGQRSNKVPKKVLVQQKIFKVGFIWLKPNKYYSEHLFRKPDSFE